MTKENLQEIEKYLIRKNLNNSVLSEVLDHFVMQISELMNNENLSFQVAFVQVKIKWSFELEMVKADWFSFRKIARIEKESLQIRFRKITLVSILFSLVALFSYFTFKESLLYILLVISTITFLVVIYLFIFKKMTFREFFLISYHPLVVRNQLFAMVMYFMVYLFNGKLTFLESSINQVFIIFALITQLQIFYFKNKKVNILLS